MRTQSLMLCAVVTVYVCCGKSIVKFSFFSFYIDEMSIGYFINGKSLFIIQANNCARFAITIQILFTRPYIPNK